MGQFLNRSETKCSIIFWFFNRRAMWNWTRCIRSYVLYNSRHGKRVQYHALTDVTSKTWSEFASRSAVPANSFAPWAAVPANSCSWLFLSPNQTRKSWEAFVSHARETRCLRGEIDAIAATTSFVQDLDHNVWNPFLCSLAVLTTSGLILCRYGYVQTSTLMQWSCQSPEVPGMTTAKISYFTDAFNDISSEPTSRRRVINKSRINSDCCLGEQRRAVKANATSVRTNFIFKHKTLEQQRLLLKKIRLFFLGRLLHSNNRFSHVAT